MPRARLAASLIAMLPVVAACSGSVAPQKARVSPPVLPHIQPAEATYSPVPSELQVIEKLDAVGLAIAEAQLRFGEGQELYLAGFLSRAKQEFDQAIDILLETSAEHPQTPRLEHVIADLTSKIHALELLALKDGDGFTDPESEPADLDDLRRVQTFPPKIDPRLRTEIEKEVQVLGHDLPIEVNDRVLSVLDYFTTRRRGGVTVGLERMGRYRPMIEDILNSEGVPLDLIYLAQAESAFQPRALSRAKAKGMWQFISSRGKEYGLRQTWWIDERSDPEKSTRAAARHLKDLYEQFGDWYLAMAAYNCGPVRVQRAIDRTGTRDYWKLAEKRALPNETINYIPIILAYTIIGKNPEKYGFNVEGYPPLETERIPVDKATDLRVIAEAIGVPVAELKDLNPHVLRLTTPPNDPEFHLIVPRGMGESVAAQVATLPEATRVQWRHHSVRRGDTLGVVARRYGTSVAELAQANNIPVKRPLRVGQDLIIPISGRPPVVTKTAAVAANPTRRPAPPREGTAAVYTIRRGDTLSTIAGRHGMTVASLKMLNDLKSNRLIAGARLRVAETADTPAEPAPRKIVHKVRRGETLRKIATVYRTTVPAILSWNSSNNLSIIRPGDEITIFVDRD